MRWNLQVRATAAAAPPSAAEPAPPRASAVGGRVPRAGSESRLRPVVPAGPARRARGRRRRLKRPLAAGTPERSLGSCGEPAGAENGGGGLEELNGAGTPGGGPESRRTAPGARGRVRCWAAELPAWLGWGRRWPEPPRLRGWGWQGTGGGGLPSPATSLRLVWPVCPSPVGLSEGNHGCRPDFFFKDRAGRGLGCGESPGPVN